MILGGQFVSRINMNLREDKGYTYGARTAFEFRRAPGPFVLHASVQSDATADALREALGEIRAIRGERPVTREELELGRASLTRGYPRNFETADQVARGAAQLALYDLPDDYFTTFVPEGAGADGAGRHRDRRRSTSIPSRLLTVVVGDRDKLAAVAWQGAAISATSPTSAMRLTADREGGPLSSSTAARRSSATRTRRIRSPRPAARSCASAPARSTISISGSGAASIASKLPLPHISGSDIAGEVVDPGGRASQPGSA